ncbi:hypothetical protein T02_13411 [Trichinella nativa]|uniref:Uncharacterized protein n=1 Tax=Trichinella nativa TaxID=6335 RepID=A0A0V1KRP6_9BILA|nr:hypothetical protein T02_13411 [Trichinella nativa]
MVYDLVSQAQMKVFFNNIQYIPEIKMTFLYVARRHVDEPLLTLFPTFTPIHHYAQPAVFVFAIRFDTIAPLCAALLLTALHSVASPQ